MPMSIRYQYPGDPPTRAVLLFGAEFLAGNPDRYLSVTMDGQEGERIDLGDDIICDACNASVGPTDPCALSRDRLYCWPCAQEWLLKYRLPGGAS